MKKKIIMIMFALCLILPCACIFTACGGNKHEHTYSTEWTSDATSHWHSSTCDHKEETSAKANHTYGEISYTWIENDTKCTASHKCTVCGYEEKETVAATGSVTQSKSCTEDELSTKTATFTNSAFAKQTKQNVKTADKTGHSYDNKGQCTHTDCTDNKGKTLTFEDHGKNVTFTPVGDKIYFNFTTIDEDNFWFDTETQQALTSEITEDTPCLVKSIKLYKDDDLTNEIEVSRDTDYNEYYYFYWESDEQLIENTKYYVVVTLDKEYDSFVGYFEGVEKYNDRLSFDSEINEKVYDGQAFTVTATSTKGLDVIVKYSSDNGTTWTDTAPTNAGTYKVKAYTEDTATVNGATEISKTITITQKEVGLSWTAPAGTDDGNIVYDGTEHYGSVSLTGVVEGDDCSVADDDIDLTGENKDYSTDGFKFTVSALTGKDSANYKLPANCDSDTLYITKRVLKLDTVHATFNTTKLYNNTVVLNSYLSSGSIIEGDVVKINIAKVDSESGISVGVKYTNLYNGKANWAITVSSESNANYDLLIDEANNFAFVTDKVELVINAKIKVQFINSVDGYTGENAIALTADICENEFEDKPLTATLNIKFKKNGEYSVLGTKIYTIDLNSSDWYCYLNSAWYTLSKASTIVLEVYDEDITSTVLEDTGYTQDYAAGNPYYFKTTIATTGLYQLTTSSSDFVVRINDKQPVKDNLYLLEAGDYLLVTSYGQENVDDGVIKLVLKTSTDISTDLLNNGSYTATSITDENTYYYIIDITTAGVYTFTYDDDIDGDAVDDISIVGQTAIDGSTDYKLNAGYYILQVDSGVVANGNIQIDCVYSQCITTDVDTLTQNLTVKKDGKVYFEIDLEETEYTIMTGSTLDICLVFKSGGAIVGSSNDFTIDEDLGAGTYYVVAYNDGEKTTTGAFGIQ